MRWIWGLLQGLSKKVILNNLLQKDSVWHFSSILWYGDMSLDKDIATGWDKDLFGSTADSVKEGLENLIEYLKLHSTMDQEYDSKQMSFFESLLNKISLLNL